MRPNTYIFSESETLKIQGQVPLVSHISRSRSSPQFRNHLHQTEITGLQRAHQAGLYIPCRQRNLRDALCRVPTQTGTISVSLLHLSIATTLSLQDSITV